MNKNNHMESRSFLFQKVLMRKTLLMALLLLFSNGSGFTEARAEDGCEHHEGHASHEGHDHKSHDEHDHAAHEGHDHASHEGHDHALHDGQENPAGEEAGHEGHDHHAAEAGVVHLSGDAARKIGLQIRKARGGPVARSTVFPAEIKLNRDRAAMISPRYAGVVRELYVEIGDAVTKGQRLALLENRETLTEYTLTSPLDGVVIVKNASPGETAVPDRILLEVADLRTVWADISVFPQYQHLLKKGMPVEFIAHDGHTARGRVQYISPIINHETRTFMARSVLEEPDEDFTPNAFVRARVTLQRVRANVRVEERAVQRVEGEEVVFVPMEGGYQSREVQTGIHDGRFVEILGGLNPGESYVASGAFSLKAEMVTSGMDPHAGHGH